MRKSTYWLVAGLMLAVAIVDARAEVIEEIVAWVNGDIITKSELEEEEQAFMAELYRRFTGEELDQQVQMAKDQMLSQMIDRKILLHRASRLFDFEVIADSLLEQLMDEQGIKTEEELDQLLAQEGLTREDLRKRLVENVAPEEILRMEVTNRISISDEEVDVFYAENPQTFQVPAQFTLREIVLLAEGDQRGDELKTAQELRLQATAPDADFAELAKAHSEAGTKDEGGLLGPLGKGDLNPALETIALTIPVGSVSEVLEMPYGFHIILVESRTDAGVMDLVDVRTEIENYLQNQKYFTALDEFLKKARAEAEIEVNPRYKHRMIQ